MKKILIAFICFFLCSCEMPIAGNSGPTDVIISKENAAATQKNDADNHNVENALLTPSNDYDRVAMKMAGIFAEEKFLNDPAYVKYVSFLDKEWSRLSDESLSLITLWANENINARVRETDTVFYPFGGPDVAYAVKFFPNSSKYILVGLERIGNFNEISKRFENTHVIPHLEEAIKSYLRGGYFITSEMMKHLSNNVLHGTLCTILLQLAKLNFKVLDVKELSINSEGQEFPRSKEMIDCVKIRCFEIGTEKEKTIYYVRMDLSNSNSKLRSLLNFVNSSPFCTFIKSSSYALHDHTLSKMKHFILAKSQFLLQDDTGIPFNDFDNSWNKYVFGTYTNPTLSVFKGYKQKSLENFYEKSDPVKIPFKIGYGYKLARPNLLLGVPKTSRIEQDQVIINDMEATKNSVSKCDSCDQ